MSALDLALQLWRAKLLMFLVFLPIALAGVGLALLFPVKYAAATRLLVTLGQEYVYDPVMGEAGRGAFPQQEEVMQAEAELARSPVIAERAIDHFSLAKLYPELALAAGRAPEAKRGVYSQKAIEAFGKDFSAYAGPKSSILRLSYSHKDPRTAASVINELVKIYLDYRREVLTDRGAGGLGEQRGAIETRLKTAEDALRAFLAQNKISDFAAEQAAVTRLYGALSDELSKVEADLREAQGRAEGLRAQLRATPKEIDLYTETTTEQQLYDLKSQREQMLARYRPDSQTIQDMDRRISAMEVFLRAGKPGGLRRIGPNPTWQTLDADKAAAEANATALSGRARELSRQKEEAAKRLTELAAIEPDYQKLVRDTEALETAAKSFATREQEERARSELAARRADNISVYEPARPPLRGASPRRAIAGAGVVLGLLTALLVGVLRAWRAPGFAMGRSLSRATGLPTLAAIAERGA